jgi:hypothetical protein
LSQASRAFKKGAFLLEYCGDKISKLSALLMENEFANDTLTMKISDTGNFTGKILDDLTQLF